MSEYYNIMEDLAKYPDAWCYVIYSPRGPGKTYSTLKGGLDTNIQIVYIKRTMEDVELICTSDDESTDFSPYKPINRDMGTNIKPKSLKKGIGAFYHCDGEMSPYGKPVAYLVPMSGVRKFKGFDMSECDWIVFDEFIPQLSERINRHEGDLLMDLYMTVARDREKRGRKPLKLILLANASEISTPITNTLELVDDMADMEASGACEKYIEDRGIYIHHLIEDKYKITTKDSPIVKGMGHTAWGKMAFEGSFAYNDFSNIEKLSLKGMKPLIHLRYKTYHYYIYQREYDGMYYMCSSPSKCPFEYDLNKENDQKLFMLEHQIDLRLSCIEGNMRFLRYTMYDLIVNYKKFFTT